MANLESILQFFDNLFDVDEFPDYSRAWNGLQVEGPEEVGHIAAAVDASEQTIGEAVRRKADLLLVHHGLFWGGSGPLTGARYRKVAALVRAPLALYSLHLPLDAHPELGNSALLARALGLEPAGGFASFQGVEIGWWAEASLERDGLRKELSRVLDGEVQLIPGGPPRVERVGIVTGGGASALREAAAMGLDTMITGEAPHHAYHEGMELGINLLLGGHYATETFGVKALAEATAGRFDVTWEFLDFPTGL